LEVRNGSVKLGFEVDASVPIHRWEVWQKIHSIPPAERPEPLIVL
jgi:sRNA-binding carbon storage regulator CsrA